MPSCCLLLCRAFVRVDGVRVALHDTRWFIDFDEAAGHSAPEAVSFASPPPVSTVGGWEAVRPAAAADAAAAVTGDASAAVGATALLLCNEQQRGGPMGAVREALGLPPLRFSSPMLRADAALAATGVHPAVAESMRTRGPGSAGPGAAHASVGCGPSPEALTIAASEGRPATGDADGEQEPPGGGGFSWAIDADEDAALAPSVVKTWVLHVPVLPTTAAAAGAAT